MIARRLACDRRGVAAIEFAITSPVYLLALLGLAQAGLWLWSGFSLQRAADAASRWAALQCGTISSKWTSNCPTGSQVQTYAATHIAGISVPSTAFSVALPSLGSCGVQVSAAYGVPTFTSGLGLPSITVHATACYPT